MELKLSPTEHRLYEALADGEPHEQDELLGCLDDPEPNQQALYQAVYRLRIKLGKVGEDVIAQSGGKFKTARYRRIRHIKSVDPGYLLSVSLV